jgi:Mg2+ and Co2+ transporter CorA
MLTEQKSLNASLNNDASILSRLSDDATSDLIKAYPSGIHLARTLDQSYFSGLKPEDLDARDKNQILSNQSGLIPSTDVEKHNPLLMVHQLWLWIIDDRTVITAFSQRPHATPNDRTIDIMQYVKNCTTNARRHALFPNSDVYDTAGQILCACINFVDQPDNLGLSESLFNIFERAIGDLSQNLSKRYQGLEDTLSLSIVEAVSINEEAGDLLKVRRLREELSMIKQVLEQQLQVWNDFSKAMGTISRDSRKSSTVIIPHRSVDGPLPPRVTRFIQRVDQIDQRAGKLESDINFLIDLKQKQANLNEARSTSTQGNAVLVFTIVTVLFTPLSFMAGLFALPIVDKFPQNSNGNNAFSSLYLGKWFGKCLLDRHVPQNRRVLLLTLR